MKIKRSITHDRMSLTLSFTDGITLVYSVSRRGHKITYNCKSSESLTYLKTIHPVLHENLKNFLDSNPAENNVTRFDRLTTLASGVSTLTEFHNTLMHRR